jgi:hypothetical protein
MSKAVVVGTQRQHVRIRITQSLDAGITTIGMEIIVVPNMDVVRKGILIRSITKLANKLGGISVGRNLNPSSTLPIAITGVIRIP